MNSVELFAGCGGLALGISEAGFRHQLIVEINAHAYSTLDLNRSRKVKHIAEWPIVNGDIRDIDYSKICTASIDLVSGGPPCQPFSIGGAHKGPKDKRNMWPEAIRCIREVRPKGFIFENVKGLLRPAFSKYLHYLQLQLSFPEIVKKAKETDSKHYSRLIKHQKQGGISEYTVQIKDINTADYGAAQKRNRALIIGIRNEFSDNWLFPERTHSREALVWAKYKTGEYWTKYDLPNKKLNRGSAEEKRILKRLEGKGAPVEMPWVTVRDVIGDLPCPIRGDKQFVNHEYHPGARIYVGHTGSGLDEPAKALKAGDHGVPGGENVLVQHGGRVRYFTIREMARLQGLPDEYEISGTWVNSIKQLGNAVPVQIGAFFGEQIFRTISAK